MLIKASTIQEARKRIDKAITEKKKQERIIVEARGEDFNRKVLENKKVNVLLNPGLDFKGKDKLKQRDSGLNEVLCKIARDNKIKIAFDVEKIIKEKGKERAVLLSRLIQNIMLCKKAGTEVTFLGNYDKKNLFSLLLTLGASTKQAKEATS